MSFLIIIKHLEWLNFEAFIAVSAYLLPVLPIRIKKLENFARAFLYCTSNEWKKWIFSRLTVIRIVWRSVLRKVAVSSKLDFQIELCSSYKVWCGKKISYDNTCCYCQIVSLHRLDSYLPSSEFLLWIRKIQICFFSFFVTLRKFSSTLSYELMHSEVPFTFFLSCKFNQVYWENEEHFFEFEKEKINHDFNCLSM